MQALSPSPLNLKPLIRTPLISTVKCSYSRADCKSSYAILSGKVLSKSSIAAVNGHKSADVVDLDPIQIELAKPQLKATPTNTITDLSRPPTHGAQLRVAYQGVPNSYSEVAGMKLTVKTLKGSHFDVRVQPSDTVSQILFAILLSLAPICLGMGKS